MKRTAQSTRSKPLRLRFIFLRLARAPYPFVSRPRKQAHAPIAGRRARVQTTSSAGNVTASSTRPSPLSRHRNAADRSRPPPAADPAAEGVPTTSRRPHSPATRSLHLPGWSRVPPNEARRAEHDTLAPGPLVRRPAGYTSQIWTAFSSDATGSPFGLYSCATNPVKPASAIARMMAG